MRVEMDDDTFIKDRVRICESRLEGRGEEMGFDDYGVGKLAR